MFVCNYSNADTNKSSLEVHESSGVVASEEDNNSNNLFENGIDSCEEPRNDETITNLQEPSASAECHQSDECNRLSVLSQKQSSNFPKSAQVFIDAIKKNRSYQKFIRSKLAQIESRIEENNKLKERVKILKDFQVSCRKVTGRALSQKKDLRVQLISSSCNSRKEKDSEVNLSFITLFSFLTMLFSVELIFIIQFRIMLSVIIILLLHLIYDVSFVIDYCSIVEQFRHPYSFPFSNKS